jgi:hypothetical protein
LLMLLLNASRHPLHTADMNKWLPKPEKVSMCSRTPLISSGLKHLTPLYRLLHMVIPLEHALP